MKYINVHSLTRRRFHTSNSSIRRTTLFFKTSFLKNNYYKLQSGKGLLCSERDEKAPFYLQTKVQPNTHTVTWSTHRQNSSTAGPQVFTPNPQAVHRKTQLACAHAWTYASMSLYLSIALCSRIKGTYKQHQSPSCHRDSLPLHTTNMT